MIQTYEIDIWNGNTFHDHLWNLADKSKHANDSVMKS